MDKFVCSARGQRMARRVRSAAGARFGKSPKRVTYSSADGWQVHVETGGVNPAETGDYGGGLRSLRAVVSGRSISFEDT